jgi:hypothetical protein
VITIWLSDICSFDRANGNAVAFHWAVMAEFPSKVGNWEAIQIS